MANYSHKYDSDSCLKNKPVIFQKLVNSSSCVINWDTITFDNGPAKDYEVHYRQMYTVDVASCGWRKWKSGIVGNTVTVRGLKPKHYYQFSIMGKRELDQGKRRPCSQTIQAKDPCLKNKPVIFQKHVNSSSCIINWDPVTFDSVPAKYYELYCREIYNVDVDSCGWRKWKSGIVGNTFTVRGLKPMHYYQFSITAKNELNQGKRGPHSRIIQAIEEPSPPRCLREIHSDCQSAFIKWTEPDFNGGIPITGYNIECFPCEEDWYPVTQGEVLGEEFVIRDLVRGHVYKVRLAAINKAGRSQWSDESSEIEAIQPPSPPPATNVLHNNHNSCVLEWSVPEDDGASPVTGYTIEQQRLTEEEWCKVVSVKMMGSTKCKIRSLTTSQKYNFRVAAINKKGCGKHGKPSGYVEMIEPPSPAGCPFVVESGIEYLVIAWRKPNFDGGTPVRGYQIKYCQVVESVKEWYDEEEFTSDMIFRINNLKADSSYKVCVAARNKAGVSDWSQESSVMNTNASPPAYEDNISPQLLEDNKTNVKDFIKQAVQNQNPISKIKQDLKKQDLLQTTHEELYIERKFTKYCFTNLLQPRIMKVIQTNIIDIDIDIFAESLVKSETIANLTKLHPSFEQEPILAYMMENLDTSNCFTKDNMHQVKRQCWDYLTVQSQTLQDENTFIEEFISYLKQCFLDGSKTVLDSASLPDKVGGVLNTIEKQKSEHLNHLQHCLKLIEKPYSPHFTKCLQEIIEKFSTPTTFQVTKIRNQTMLICKGNFMDLRRELDKIKHHLSQSNEINEVHICAQYCLKGNCNLKDGFAGLNLVILADEISISSSIEWNVSGVTPQALDQPKAVNGQNPGDDGECGKHGLNGQSAGNVLILSNKLCGQDKLTLVSNGADGLNGQSGGNGANGKDGDNGKCLSEREFKQKFSRQIYFFSDKSQNGIRIREEHLNETRNKFYRFTMDEKYYGTYNYFLSLYGQRQIFCLLEGQEGTKGTKGGDGGEGGYGGKGGYSGDVTVKNLQTNEIFNIESKQIDGKDGTQGSHGSGGKGGVHGKKGEDNAKVEFLTTQEYKHDHLEISYTDKKSSLAVWCGYKNKYAIIGKGVPPTGTKAEDGEKVKEKKNQQRQAQQTRQTPIIEENVKQQHTDIISVSELHSNYSKSFSTKTKDMAEEALDQTFEQATSTEVIIEQSYNNDKAGSRRKMTVRLAPPLVLHSKQHEIPKELTTIAEKFSCIKCLAEEIDKIEVILLNSNRIQDENMQDLQKCILLLCKHVIFSIMGAENHKKLGQKLSMSIISMKEKVESFLKEFEITDAMNKATHFVRKEVETMTTEQTITNFLKHNDWSMMIKHVSNNEIQNMFSKLRFLKPSHSTSNRTSSDPDRTRITTMDNHNSPEQDLLNVDSDRTRITMMDNHNSPEQDLLNVDPDRTRITMMDNHNSTEQDLLNVDPDRTRITMMDNHNRPEQDLLNDLQSLMKLLVLKFICSKTELPPEEIQWYIGNILSLLDDDRDIHSFIEEELYMLHGIKIFGMFDCNKWFVEFVALHISSKLEITGLDKCQMREQLHQIKDVKMILFLEHKITKEKTLPSVAVITRTLHILREIQLDKELKRQLICVNFAEWEDLLQWLHTLVYVQKLPSSFSDNQVEEISYYGHLVKNHYGVDLFEDLVECIQCNHTEIEATVILRLLTNVCNHQIILDSKYITTLKRPVETWKMETNLQSNVRTLEEIVSIVKQDSNNSTRLQYTFEEIQEKLAEINSLEKCYSKVLLIEKQICDYSEQDIKDWTTTFSKVDEKLQFISEVLCVVERSVELVKGFPLRDTQRFSVALFILNRNNTGILQQMSTGEGKTIVIVVLAITLSLMGEKVDIITSSPVLAKRDAEENLQIYGIFQTDVSHNCSEILLHRKTAYQCSVVYGEIGAFQRDLLLDTFYNENILGNRTQSCVIVDEVDSMLLDKGQNILYLSHSIPSLDDLEPVYVYIWHLVNSNSKQGTNEDVDEVYIAILDMAFGLVRDDDFRDLINQSEINELFSHMEELGILKSNGTILKRDCILNGRVECPTFIDYSMFERVMCRLKDIASRETLIQIPNHMKSYFYDNLENWIENAFHAKMMVEGEQYIVDYERVEMKNGKVNVIIMDNQTGTEQFHSHWNKGLHQFLQLKHTCYFTPESLKAVFMSNITFLKQYNKLFGLTGTLGSISERQILQDIYKVQYVNVPTYKCPKFEEKEPVIATPKQEWKKKIVQTAKNYLEIERPVLVICENIKAVDELSKTFASDNYFEQNEIEIVLYKHSTETPKLLQESQSDKAFVMIATNLAGRGTDIKISDGISELGGLHVVLSYLPTSLRVEQQAFGRAARKGQNGSGQIILHPLSQDPDQMEAASHRLQLIFLRNDRDRDEENRIQKIRKKYDTVIRREEDLFQEFMRLYKQVKKDYQESGLKKEEIEIHQKALLDKWAFWLSGISSDIESKTNEEIVFPSTFWDMSPKVLSQYLPSQLLQLGKLYSKQGKYEQALECYDQIINHEPSFCEAAVYYKAQIWIKKKKEKEDISCLLYLAEEMIIEKINKATTLPGILKTGERKSIIAFLETLDYEEQKKQEVGLYQIILQNIHNIIGQEITLDMLEDLAGEPILAEFYCEELLKTNILKLPCLNMKKLDFENTHSQLCEMFELYHDDIVANLHNMRKKEFGKPISPDQFKGILPCREEFWECLLDSGVLHKDRHLRIVQLDVVNNMQCISKLMLDQLKRLKCHKIPFSQLQNNQELVWMYEEHKVMYLENENTFLVAKETLETFCWPLPIYKTLLRKQIIIETRTACCVQENIEKPLQKFDSITRNDIEKIRGINENMASAIFDELVQLKVITTAHPSRLMLNIKISSVELTKHQRFQREVRNVLDKHFTYRLALRELVNKEKTPISLPFNTHLELYEALKTLHIIKPLQVCNSRKIELPEIILKKEEMTSLCNSNSTESIWNSLKQNDFIKKGAGNWQVTRPKGKAIEISPDEFCQRLEETFKKSRSKYSHVVPLQYLLSSKLNICQRKCEIEELLQGWKNKLYSFDDVDANLSDICDLFSKEVLADHEEEVCRFICKGFDSIITLEERKWTLKTLLTAAAIFTFGILQVVTGILVEIFSMGFMTHVGGALLSEGIGDMIYAAQGLYRGHCSMKDYSKYKALSAACSIVTAGTGAIFSRGARLSRFSYKIQGEYMQHSGKQLIAKVGIKRITKEASKIILKKTFEASAIEVANIGIDKSIEFMLRDKINAISESVLSNFETSISQHPIIAYAVNLRKEAGSVKVLQMLEKADKNVQSGSYIPGNIKKVLGSISQGLCQAMKKIHKSNANTSVRKLSAATCGISAAVKFSKIAEQIRRVYSLKMSHLSSIQQELEKQSKLDFSSKQCSDAGESEEIFKSTVANFCKDSLKQQLNLILEEEICRPVLQTLSQKAIRFARKQIQKKIRQYQQMCVRQDKEKLKEKYDKKLSLVEPESEESNKLKDCYIQGLVLLMKRTRDVDLYIEMVKEGVPLTIHSVQAISTILGKQIIMHEQGGDNALPTTFNPTAPSVNLEPIHIFFEHGAHGIGHYYVLNDNGEKSNAAHDCLLDAVNNTSTENLSREDIIAQIQKDPKIHHHIVKGYHEHSLDKGGIGGVSRSEKITKKMKKIYETAWYKIEQIVTKIKSCGTNKKVVQCFEQEKKKIIESLKIRDKAKESYSGHGSHGNHELAPLKMVGCIVDKEIEYRIENPEICMKDFTYLDLMKMKIDTKWILYLYNGKVQGHSGTLVTTDGGSVQEGQKQFHRTAEMIIEDASSPKEAAVHLLENYFQQTLHSLSDLSESSFTGLKLKDGRELSDKQVREEVEKDLQTDRSIKYIVWEKMVKMLNVKIPERLHCAVSKAGAICQKLMDNPFVKVVREKVSEISEFDELMDILMMAIPGGSALLPLKYAKNLKTAYQLTKTLKRGTSVISKIDGAVSLIEVSTDRYKKK